MHAPEVVIQLQNDLGRYLARTTQVVISLVPPYVTMCKVYCRVTLLWKNPERAHGAGRGQSQLTVQMNDWDIRTTTFLGLTCLWVSFLAKKETKKKTAKMVLKKKKKKKKTACTAWGALAVVVMLSSFPGLPTKSFLKSILHSNEIDDMKFQFRFASVNARSSPAFGQRTSVDQLAQLSAAPMTGFFSWRGLIQQRALEVHSFSAGMQRRDAFISFSKGVTCTGIAHAWRKTQKNVLVWSAILHVVELRVLVYSCVHLKFCQIRKSFCILAYFRDMCCTCIMSDNVLAVGLFWRNDLGCASVVPSEQTSSSYIILDIKKNHAPKPEISPVGTVVRELGKEDGCHRLKGWCCTPKRLQLTCDDQ